MNTHPYNHRTPPPGKGRALPAAREPYVPKPPLIDPLWLLMPENTPEEKKAKDRAGMMWHCDELHVRGRTDLAESFSKGWKLGWKPAFAARQMPQTAAMEFSETLEDDAAVTRDLNAADYDPFTGGR